jgi:hypothetical protein
MEEKLFVTVLYKYFGTDYQGRIYTVGTSLKAVQDNKGLRREIWNAVTEYSLDDWSDFGDYRRTYKRIFTEWRNPDYWKEATWFLDSKY